MDRAEFAREEAQAAGLLDCAEWRAFDSCGALRGTGRRRAADRGGGPEPGLVHAASVARAGGGGAGPAARPRRAEGGAGAVRGRGGELDRGQARLAHRVARGPHARAARRPGCRLRLRYARMLDFVRALDQEADIGAVLHIGIGGSDWGRGWRCRLWRPHAAASDPFRFEYRRPCVQRRGDRAGRGAAWWWCRPSFTTAETLHNARAAIAWLRRGGVTDVAAHLAAVTANAAAARALGVPAEQVFSMCDWVGGRYSVWSVAGLSIALTVGAEVLIGMRAGAEAMDQHFRLAPLASMRRRSWRLPVWSMQRAGPQLAEHRGLQRAAAAPGDLPAAAGDGIAGQAGGGRWPGRGRAVRAHHLGHARHRRAAHLLPVAAPGENGAPVDFIASLQGCPDNGRAPHAAGQLPGAAGPCCAARAWSRRCWTWPISTTASARCVWRGTWCIPAGVLPR